MRSRIGEVVPKVASATGVQQGCNRAKVAWRGASQQKVACCINTPFCMERGVRSFHLGHTKKVNVFTFFVNTFMFTIKKNERVYFYRCCIPGVAMAMLV